MFKVGNIVKSVYDDKQGVVVSVDPAPNEIQEFYEIIWADGKVEKVAREEIY